MSGSPAPRTHAGEPFRCSAPVPDVVVVGCHFGFSLGIVACRNLAGAAVPLTLLFRFPVLLFVCPGVMVNVASASRYSRSFKSEDSGRSPPPLFFSARTCGRLSGAFSLLAPA